MKSFKALLVYPNIQMVNLIPTNVGLLTACLKRAGIEVKIFDATYYKTKAKSHDEVRVEVAQYKSAASLYKTTNVYDDFEDLYNSFDPDMIAFSTVDATYPLGIKLLHSIDTQNKHVTFGGIFPTFAPNLAISDPQVDSICIGEGEISLVDLATRLRDGKSISDTPNFWIRERDDTITKNMMQSVTKLEDNPFEDFTDFEPERFLRPMQGELKKMLPVTIDRGCPYQCTFCAEPTIRSLYKKSGAGESFRVIDPERLDRYFTYMLNTYEPDYIYFNSETFFARPLKHLKVLAEYYKNHVQKPFCCMTRIETITEERMDLLITMGCDRLSLGLEHGDDEFRKRIVGKPYTTEGLNKSMEILKRYKVPLTFFNIIGFPDETEELAYKTIEMNHRLVHEYNAPISASASAFQPYFSTPLRQYCIKQGYITEDDYPGDLIQDYVLRMPQFSNERVRGIARCFALYVYLPKEYWPDIKIAEQLTPEGEAAFKDLRAKLTFK